MKDEQDRSMHPDADMRSAVKLVGLVASIVIVFGVWYMTVVCLILWAEGGCEIASFTLCHLGVMFYRECA